MTDALLQTKLRIPELRSSLISRPHLMDKLDAGMDDFVVQWAIPDLLKNVIIPAIALVVVIGWYEFVARRCNLLRFLFGTKVLGKPAGL